MQFDQTRLNAINAYGGEDLWRQAQHIEISLDATGLAFILKQRAVYEDVKMRLDVHRPYAEITPLRKKDNITGILDGGDVRLIDTKGNIVEERKNARLAFNGMRRWLWWDDLDMCYFGNYAMWNYITLPALLMREDITWIETQPGSLKAIFPANIPTHCQIQEFHFDLTTGLLKQHNYTPDIISRFAKASNRVIEHKRSSDGIIYASERLVTPLSPTGKLLESPKIIELSIRNFKLI